MLVLIWSLLIALVQGQDSGNVFKPDPLTPGPWVKMSHGAIWPRPAQQSSWPNFFVLDPKSFKLQVGFTGVIIFTGVKVAGGSFEQVAVCKVCTDWRTGV